MERPNCVVTIIRLCSETVTLLQPSTVGRAPVRWDHLNHMGVEPGSDPHYAREVLATSAHGNVDGCSKVTVSEHSVLHLVSCCQTNNNSTVPERFANGGAIRETLFATITSKSLSVSPPNLTNNVHSPLEELENKTLYAPNLRNRDLVHACSTAQHNLSLGVLRHQ